MQLDSITLKNFRNHRDRTFTFKPGVNGIIGKNGQGKSAIIEAIRFVYTGTLDDTKEDTITIGETEGYVRALFTLNGKQGTIERQLGASKVSLKYDDKSYNKATEVKELWNNLLQIDETIFNNVIIAKQGEIPLLFDGNDGTREKIFQKIFLVPPTEKARAIIWENYIKTCPPEYMTDVVALLRGNIAELVGKMKPVQKQIDDILSRILDVGTMNSAITRISFLKDCQTDAKERPDLEQQYATLLTEVVVKEKEKAEAAVSLSAVDVTAYKKEHDEMLLLKFAQKERANTLATYDTLKSQLAIETEVKRFELEKAELTETVKALHEQAITAKTKLTAITSSLGEFSKLIGCAICPTCKQEIADLQKFIKEQQTLQAALHPANQKADLALFTAQSRLCVLEEYLHHNNSIKLKLENVEEKLNQLTEAVFSEDAFTLIKQVITKYQQTKDIIAALNTTVTRLQGQAALVENQMKNLCVYDGSESPAEEIQVMTQVLQVNQQRKDELNNARLEEAKFQTEIKLIEERIDVSLANEKKNAKRNKYLGTLNAVYDLFHVSQFPRKLIQSYSSDVQDLLAVNVQKFNIPYTPQIVEGFKIQMVDENNRVVPKVSGGQKVVVGLALRLALHSLFAQSFPMWIVDEGTTHLDQDNVKLYFDTVKQLKQTASIKQVIIIDHNEGLADVVDNVIKL